MPLLVLTIVPELAYTPQDSVQQRIWYGGKQEQADFQKGSRRRTNIVKTKPNRHLIFRPSALP